MATVEIIAGERPYYTIRVTVADGRAFDQPVYCDRPAKDVPGAMADYAADMEMNLPPVEPD
jgi:hypothetical protein